MTLRGLIEIPKGSRNKYEYDAAPGGPSSTASCSARWCSSRPTNGFIPQTLGEDGDALDAMVLVGESTFRSCVIAVRAIAALRLAEAKAGTTR